MPYKLQALYPRNAERRSQCDYSVTATRGDEACICTNGTTIASIVTLPTHPVSWLHLHSSSHMIEIRTIFTLSGTPRFFTHRGKHRKNGAKACKHDAFESIQVRLTKWRQVIHRPIKQNGTTAIIAIPASIACGEVDLTWYPVFC
jgi:hypothetical protein